MGGPIDTEQKGWESVIHNHDCDLLVSKVRCKDLPDSDRGDFRRWHAIDSSSLYNGNFYTAKILDSVFILL